MRMFTLAWAVEVIQNILLKDATKIAKSYVQNDILQNRFSIHTTGDTGTEDLFAEVRIKETTSISIFKCDVYVENINWLCKRNHIYLITDEAYPVIVMWHILHPLYVGQFNDFTTDLVSDYNRMMITAGQQTADYIKKHLKLRVYPMRKLVLDILRYQMYSMHSDDARWKRLYKQARKDYRNYCMAMHYQAYRTAVLLHGQTHQVSIDGYHCLERITSIKER